MNKKLISFIISAVLAISCLPVMAEDVTEEVTQYTWDLTTATDGYSFSADSYTEIDNIISVKSGTDYVTENGITLSKSNKVRIKIVPPSDGELVVVTSRAVVMPDYEDRKGGETAVESGVAVSVTGGTVYYLQGSSSSAATISAVTYTSETPFTVTKAEPIVPTEQPTEETTEQPTETVTETPTATPTPKPTAAPDTEFDKAWDLTTLTSDDYNAESYVAIDDVVSVRAAAEYVTSNGIKATKSNGVRIKITPPSDGKLVIITSRSVVMPDYEDRKSTEEGINSNELIDVYAGVEYYIQGSSSSAAVISAIFFIENKFELFEVTGIGFNADYTKVLEFDIEKGDDYAHDITACICVYGSDGVLKTVRIRKILASSMRIGTNTIKCNLDISGYDKDNDTLKVLLFTSLD